MKRESTYLVDWQFALGDAEPDWTETRTVTIPHTWNIEDGTKETWGIGWYRCILPAQNMQGKRIFISFRSVYHDAVIFLNGMQVGTHSGSRYTPFTVELTDAWNNTADNVLVVRADNRFASNMLPYQRSFDWANDGGIIHPVNFG